MTRLVLIFFAGIFGSKIFHMVSAHNNFFADAIFVLESKKNLLEEIHHSSGQVSIQEISQKYKIGYKRIERLFRQFVGITPKQYTRLIRFSHCVKYAAQFPRKNLTDIALAHGFFDQMHFIRESKSITGQLPSRIFNQPSGALEKEHVNYLLNRSY